MTEARLHSIETMGLLDGPGIRTVFFLQGCPLRCAFCHNPDSQSMFSKKRITPEEVLQTAKKYQPYYKNTGGGVTFSGGEPLVQGEFLLESLKLLKANGFNTAIDTSGYGDERYYKDILKYTDVILLDIKHFDNEGYKDLTEKSMSRFFKFLTYLKDFHGTIWMRHVMVPTITDNKESIYKLFDRIAHLAHKIDRFEILPYHKMGLEKYKELNMDYRLDGVPEMDKEKAKEFEMILMDLLKREKTKKKTQKDIV
jgi:pyruvate formate lyase activating enzyme